MKRRGLMICLVLSLATTATTATTAARATTSRRGSPTVRVLRPTYTRLDEQEALSDGRYTVLKAIGPSGSLIDEQTGTRHPLEGPQNCSLGSQVIVGNPFLLGLCSPAPGAQPRFALYNLSSGSWRTIAINPLLIDPCTATSDTPCEPVAVGSRWIGWEQQCDECDTPISYQAIGTGAVMPDPSGGRIVASLGASRLPHTICRPLTVTPGGAARFIGPYALIFNATNTTGAPPSGAYFLQRCGSSVRQRLGTDLAALGQAGAQIGLNQKAIVWETTSGRERRLVGLRLPSRQKFQIQLPSDLGSQYGVTLSSRHLYLNQEGGGVWSAPLTSALR